MAAQTRVEDSYSSLPLGGYPHSLLVNSVAAPTMYGQKTTFAARRESCSETSAEEYRAHYMRLQLSFLLNARILFFFSRHR